jgi:hypothetical protein
VVGRFPVGSYAVSPACGCCRPTCAARPKPVPSSISATRAPPDSRFSSLISLAAVRTPHASPYPFPYLSALTSPARVRRPRRRFNRAGPRGEARAARPTGWHARQDRREPANPRA